MLLASMRRVIAALALIALLLPDLAVAASPSTPLASYPTAQEAQQHCPDDLVVWLDPPTRTYHYRGQRGYGSTKSGAYVCRNEAKKAGMRATRSAE